MKIRLLWMRSSADAELVAVGERYLNRIKHFLPIEVIEVSPPRGRQNEKDLAMMRARDSERILAAIPGQGYTVILDERGQSVDSLKFAQWLERWTIDQPHGVTFVAGGDAGMDDSVRKRGDRIVSLSAMTLPHQLARVVLLEQIYRACTLMRNIKYHK